MVPTLVTYDAMERRGAELGLAPVAQAKNREVLDAGRTAIRLAREAGVRIGFGTDLMGALDDEQLHGLRLQAEVEGPLALLRAATSVNAELLGNTSTRMIGNVIQNRFLTQNDYPEAAALSFTLMAAILIGVAVYARLLGTEELTSSA